MADATSSEGLGSDDVRISLKGNNHNTRYHENDTIFTMWPSAHYGCPME